MFFSLFLLNQRIQNPLGEIYTIPQIGGPLLSEFLKSSKKAVVVFHDGNANLDFMEYGIASFHKNINFLRSTTEDGKAHNCTTNPCLKAFEKAKPIVTSPAPDTAAEFLLWLEEVMTPHRVSVKNVIHLQKLIDEKTPKVFAVDETSWPKHLPQNHTLYLCRSAIFEELGVTLKKGNYLYRPADRQIIELKKPYNELIQSSIVDPNIDSYLTKPFFAGYMINDETDKNSEMQIDILKILAGKLPNITFGPIYGQVADSLQKSGKLAFIRKPYFVVFETSDLEAGRWVVTNNKDMYDVNHLEKFIKDIVSGAEDYTIISDDIQEYRVGNHYRKLVTNNFYEKVIEENVTSVVAFVGTNCPTCVDLALSMGEVSKIVMNTSVKLYHFDVTTNDIPEYVPKVERLPMVFIWPQGKKEDAPAKLIGKRCVENIMKFIIRWTPEKLELPEYNATEIDNEIQKLLHPEIDVEYNE